MTGPELKELRQSVRMTQREAAEAIGLNGPNIGKQISAWERGRYRINRHLANTFVAKLIPKTK